MRRGEMTKIAFKKMSEVMNDPLKTAPNSVICPKLRNR